jgi:hypothetical protein
MAWKNLKQRSLADSMLIDHEALRELDDVHALINWLPLEQLLWVFIQNLEVRKLGRLS